VGSWDDWESFSELEVEKHGDAVHSARIEVRQPPGVEEFQILQDGNWETRFCPSADGSEILGPGNMHGLNWRVVVPLTCTWLEVLWGTHESRKVQWRFLDHRGNDVEKKPSKALQKKNIDVHSAAYFLVGSWDGWKDFFELRLGPLDSTFSTCVLVNNDIEEFQIVRARDWKQRFYPSPSGEICGPGATWGRNWKAKVPKGSTFLQVNWDPRGEKSLTYRFTTRHEHHLEAAGAFTSMLLQMRSESVAGVGFLNGMKRIFSQLPACQSASPYRAKAESTATAECLLATLARDVETLLDENGPAPVCQRSALVDLLNHCESDLASSSGPLDGACEGRDWMQAAIPDDPHSKRELCLFQRLVYLPLVMYVRNTVHLYEMLDRLKAQSRNVTCAGRLRSLLDGMWTNVESPYSWLIYGVIGALQTLYRARHSMAEDTYKLELLASSPPHTLWQQCEAGVFRRAQSDNCQPMQPAGTFRGGSGLMFRGIWLPEGMGEDAMRYQYSFQSFSRSVEGVVRVLRFYSDVAETKACKAAEVGRLLIYVARAWPTSSWVTPVQLFDGPKKKALDSEEELLLPPFMIYDFEHDASIDPILDVSEKQERIEMLEELWQVELPLNLKQFIYGLLPTLNHTRTFSAEVNLSVRFINSMTPASPVVELFQKSINYLYEWKAPGL